MGVRQAKWVGSRRRPGPAAEPQGDAAASRNSTASGEVHLRRERPQDVLGWPSRYGRAGKFEQADAGKAGVVSCNREMKLPHRGPAGR